MITWRPLFHLWLWQHSYTEANLYKKKYVRAPAFSKVCLRIQNYSSLPLLKLASCQCATCFSHQLCVGLTLPTSHLSVNRFEPCPGSLLLTTYKPKPSTRLAILLWNIFWWTLHCIVGFKGSGLVNGRKLLTEDCTRTDVRAGGGEELQNGDPFSFPLINSQWPPKQHTFVTW